jgi:hypothetical protein
MQYYFKASDENEYGPIDEGEIRAWLQQGRMNQGSLVRAVDSEEWRPLNDYPEFMALLAPSSSNTTTTHPLTSGGRATLCTPSRGIDPHVRDFGYSLLFPVWNRSMDHGQQ